MKTLHIARHAKSSWEYPELSDEERPLLRKGIKRTRKSGAFLRDKKIRIDHIISSPAVRAYETARILAGFLNYPEDQIKVVNSVYHANTNVLLDQLYSLPDEINSVMLVGHNPMFTNFANHFLTTKIDWLPTSGIVSIDFNTDKWENIMMAERETKFLIFPRKLQ